MLPEMRRSAQALDPDEINEVLKKGTSGVLALSGDDGYPYAVPMSYVYESGAFLFHCGNAGHRARCLEKSDKASFCVIGRDDIVPEENTTYYVSVIAFGRLETLEGEDRLRAHEAFTCRFNPNYDRVKGEQPGSVRMIRLRVEHITGKKAKKLAEVKTL